MPVALVTGASRGIGRAISLRLAADGYDLFLVARSADRLREVASLAAPRRAVTHTADFESPGAADEVARAFREAYNTLDVLVNNAGVAIAGPIGEYQPSDWDRVMNVNARAPFFLTQALLPLLLSDQPGFVISMASAVAKKGYVNQALYSASKHALLGFTKSLARETVDAGLRVHAVLPGGVNTEMVTGVRPDIDASELISPEEVADVVMQLLRMRGNAVIDEVEMRRRTKTPWA
jgi:3-oxoacyl-[acyl-carrier protein] reductase